MKKLILVLAFVSGCSWFKSEAKPIGKAFLDCMEDPIRAKASGLVPTFVGILSGNTSTWKQQASALGKEFGSDAATCAARVALQKITEPVQSSPEEDPEQVKKEATARLRAIEIEAGYAQ